jgi:hypothetical protein
MKYSKGLLAAMAYAGISMVVSVGAAISAENAAQTDATVVVLTQTGCQFLESEGGTNQGYKPKNADDCKEINMLSGADRLATARPLTLKPGKYIFRVTNKNVPYTLGFWLRSEGYSPFNPLHKLSKTSVSGGGLDLGITRDYAVTLKAGASYEYSCPLNPTPDYKIVITQ